MPVRTARCFPLVRGKRFRITRLDGCGAPVYGDYAVAVTDSLVSVAATATTSEVEEIRVQNANGDTCAYEPGRTNLEGYALEITFCAVDPETFSLITGQEVYMDYLGNPIGFPVDTEVDLDDHGFALEVWMGVPGEACEPGAGANFGYVPFPFIKGGILGDFTIENGAINFVITGASTRGGNAWGVGPYNVLADETGDPAPLPTPMTSSTHLLPLLTSIAPPDGYCGTRPLLDPNATPLVSISGDADDSGSPLTVEFSTMPTLDDEGVWWDFGNGEWEYVVGNGDVTYTYPQAGTYTVQASSNGEWVTTSITVPAP